MTVSSRTLKVLAALVWLAVGLSLGGRGAAMLVTAHATQDASTGSVALAAALGVVLGALKGRYVLVRAARRNVRRIEALDAPRIWHVFAPKFYPVIGLMIVLGLSLRALAAREWILSYRSVGAVYIGIGAALVASAAGYLWRRPPPAFDVVETLRSAAAPRPAPPIGVLLVNLGTPDAPTPRAVRRYLREFLGDPRVVEVSRPVWAFVLNVIILPFRARTSAALYRRVWTDEGSPLLVHSRRQAELVARELGGGYRVALGMRYGSTSLVGAIEELTGAGCERIVLLPLFPQYSNTTTGTVVAAVSAILARRRVAPALTVVPPFFEDRGYVRACAARVREAVGDRPVDRYVFSFHGIPEAYVARGDPYLDHCARTARALARELALDDSAWRLAFQSRFGDEPWLQPYADELVPSLAAAFPRVLVATPGFTASCLETIDEIGRELAHAFRAAGGEELVVAPALDEHPLWIDALVALVRGAAERAPEGGSDGAPGSCGPTPGAKQRVSDERA